MTRQQRIEIAAKASFLATIEDQRSKGKMAPALTWELLPKAHKRFAYFIAERIIDALDKAEATNVTP